MTAMDTAVLGVDNILFTVGDLNIAVDFYTGKLGLPTAFRLDERGVALFRLGPETPGLLVRRAEQGVSTGGGRVWLEVRDARAVAKTLADLRGVDGGEPFRVATGWTVEVADPWGNVVGFTDYTAMPQRGRP